MDSAATIVANLYGRTHGIEMEQIQPVPMSSDPQERLHFWESFWRELGFAGSEPVGSSRLMEVAVAQSRAGHPSEMLRALFAVLGDAPTPTAALAYFARMLGYLTRSLGEASADTRDAFLPLPEVLSHAQAVLVFQFVRDASRYTAEDRARLHAAQTDPTWQGLSYEDAFVPEAEDHP